MDDSKDKWKIDDDEIDNFEPSLNENAENVISTDSVVDEYLSVPEIITGQLHKNLVIFSGPPAVGKTVALMRLTYYLQNLRDIKIEPNWEFRDDSSYQKAVSLFQTDMNQPDFSPNRTQLVNFLVLDLVKNGELYCQFLEAPGEAFFNVREPNKRSFPTYLTSILNDRELNKVFVFFFEDKMLQGGMPRAYAKRLASLVEKMNRKKDDVIIVYNKADKMTRFFDGNKPIIRSFKNYLYKNKNYNEFFTALKRYGVPVKFLPFSSGDFESVPGKEIERWIHSSDTYPESLWRSIDRCFKTFSLFG